MTQLDPNLIGFRPLVAEDIPTTHRWRNQQFVKEFYYSHDYSYAAIEAEELESITGAIPNRTYIITYADAPIGFIQAYRLHDWPDYAAEIDEPENAACLDLYIGEADYVHKGLGGPILRRFLREVLFRDFPDVVSCFISPEDRNERAKRAYAKAGFTHLKTVYTHDDDRSGLDYVMRISREEALTQELLHSLHLLPATGIICLVHRTSWVERKMLCLRRNI